MKRKATLAIWGLGAAAAVLYAAMAWLVLSHVPLSLGMPPDMRVEGYNLGSFYAFSSGLTEDARATLLGPVAAIDTVFPLTLAAFLGALIWRLSGFVRQAGRLAMLIPAAGFAVGDLVENRMVGALLRTEPQELIYAQVRAASDVTVLKFACLFIAVALILILLAHRKLYGATA